MHRSITLIAAAALAACGPNLPPKPEPVPADLVPMGFSPDECHWVKSDLIGFGGVSSIGNPVADAVSRGDGDGRKIQCKQHLQVP